MKLSLFHPFAPSPNRLFIRPFAIITLLTFTLTSLTDFGSKAFAVDIGSSASSGGAGAAQLGQIAESAGAVQSFQADLFSIPHQAPAPFPTRSL